MASVKDNAAVAAQDTELPMVLTPDPDGMPHPASPPLHSLVISEKTLVDLTTDSGKTLHSTKGSADSASDAGHSTHNKMDDRNDDKEDNHSSNANTDPATMTFPDGGFGWAVVFGAFMIQFCCWGFNFSWGVYQEFYVQNNIFPGATLSQISWSGAIGSASVFLTTPFQSSMVARFGLRPVIVTGIVISGLGMVLASFAKTLWQLYLTQGFMYGIGAGMALFTSVAIPVQWFDKKRGLASGITVAGSGIGGAVLAPLNRYMISNVGYQWALRIMGIIAVTVVCSILFCIRTRIPAKQRGGSLMNIGMFKDRGFTIMYFNGMLVTFGYLTPIFLLPKFVVDLGLKPEVGASLVSIFSGINAVSRIGLGFAADWIGALNILILSTTFCGISCLVFWMNTKGFTLAVVFVVFYGMNAGGFNSLFPVVAADIIGLEALAASVGLLYSGNFFGNLLGTPVASAIIASSGGSYTGAIVFAGVMPIVAAALLLPIRFKTEKRIFVKV
ncbi:hypothetical protein BGZ99_009114 [Dissophora globulifera]|uniref:Major facilitator superfamily (MFS) profile domain-containing protein n=1 Tax=Dissophora globulifera TaxID=979702 RepID=A0A9P6RVC4_9FUNG|nr:hypothetical protein BGZ99_009114 [Dissophora globulifera]